MFEVPAAYTLLICVIIFILILIWIDRCDPQKIWSKDVLDVTQEDVEYLRLRLTHKEFVFFYKRWVDLRTNPVWRGGTTVRDVILDFYRSN